MKFIKDWLKEIDEYVNTPLDEYFSKYFLRDPFTSINYDDNSFYSPAHGILLYSKRVKSSESFLEVKGKNYTLKDILTFDIGVECQVFGIFLTMYDIHVLRSPTTAYIKQVKQLDNIQSFNRSMVLLENDILSEKLNYDNLDYIYHNERWLINLFHPHFGDYFIVEIADKEVNSILHFVKKGEIVLQGERLSIIRFGSQVDVVIPLENNKDLGIISRWKDLIIDVPESTNELLHLDGISDKLFHINID